MTDSVLFRGEAIPLEEREGILIRKDFGPDVGIILEYRPTYRRMIHAVKGHKFLDIGANLGLFSVRAMENGAVGGVCYEPEPEVRRLLRANIEKWNRKIKIVPAAITKKSGTALLSVPKSGNAVTASTYFTNKLRKQVKVKAVAFHEAIESSKATLVKIDIEGAELEFLNGRSISKQVQVICGELHREHGNEEKCQRIIASFAKWTPIHPPASYSFKRCWTVAWSR